MRYIGFIYNSYAISQKGGSYGQKSTCRSPWRTSLSCSLGEGNTQDTSHHSTQKAAMQAAREIAKNQKSEMVVHKVNGQFGTKNSYGNDPCPPHG